MLRVLTVVLLGLFLALQYRLWVAPSGVAEYWNLKQDIKQQKLQNDDLTTLNMGLMAEVQDLKNGTAAIGERARSELGMIKQGETFYQIITPPTKG